MKKIFTLFVVLLCAIVAKAENVDLVEWYIQGDKVVKADVFTDNNLGQNGAYTGTYVNLNGDEIVCTNGAKMQNSTYVNFSTERSATVIIVQSISRSGEENKTLKFDGVEMSLESGVENPAGCKTVRVYTLKGVNAGDHSVTRGSGQTGLMYVGFVLDELIGVQLDAPEITFNDKTGEVTIAADENASKIVYTTDGSSPTEESEEYTEPFTVADGTTVKAMAIGDGTAYANSTISTVEVVLVGLDCAAPEFAQFNGTFALSTETPLATCEYSLDGENWVAYTIPVTLFKTATVKARTVRENWNTSAVTEEEVVALESTEGTKTVLLGGGAFERTNSNKTLSGIAESEADGYSISLESKTWTITKDKITISEGVTRTAYYGSNGATNTLTLPEHIKVYRVTFYSYMPALGRASGWNDINGETNNSKDIVPLLSQDPANPDVRAFNLDGVEGSFTFAQTGERPNFVIALEVLDDTVGIENVTVDNNDAAVEYFNLQGVRVVNPENGLYIRRQGNDVKKVIL